MEDVKDPVLRKYARINKSGKEQLREGNIAEFKGFEQDLTQRFNVSVLFSEQSNDVILKRVVGPIESIAAQNGIQFFMAGRDFPIHSTIQEGLFQKDEKEKTKLFEGLSSQFHTGDLINTFVGLDINFKYVLTDRGNVVLTAPVIPDPILSARGALSSLYSSVGLKVLPMEHILHITIGRMNQIPEEQEFEKYVQDMRKIRESVSKDPVQAQVGNVFIGNAWDLIHQ